MAETKGDAGTAGLSLPGTRSTEPPFTRRSGRSPGKHWLLPASPAPGAQLPRPGLAPWLTGCSSGSHLPSNHEDELVFSWHLLSPQSHPSIPASCSSPWPAGGIVISPLARRGLGLHFCAWRDCPGVDVQQGSGERRQQEEGRGLPLLQSPES